MTVTIVPIVVALTGLLTYVLSSNTKVAEVGRIGFAVGLLVAVYMLAGMVVKL